MLDCSEKTLVCFLADSLDNWCEFAERYYGIFRRIPWVKAVFYIEFNFKLLKEHSFVLVRILNVKTTLKTFSKLFCIKILFINTWSVIRIISFYCLFITCNLVCYTAEWSCSFDYSIICIYGIEKITLLWHTCTKSELWQKDLSKSDAV